MSATATLPRISVITPSLNQGSFIERTLQSVLDQSYPGIEYIVIDGGSTDNSVEVIERYADQLAYWCSEPDSGQSSAINKGLRRATGDIVAYINSDDQLLPGSLAFVAEHLQDLSVPWIAGGCSFTDPTGKFITQWLPEQPPLRRHPVLAVIYPWGVPQPACFWRRQLFEQYGYFREDLHYLMDTEFQVRLVLEGQWPRTEQRLLANAIIHPASKTGSSKGAFWKEEQKLLDLLGDRLTPQQRMIGRTMRRLLDGHASQYWTGTAAALREWFYALAAAPRVVGRATLAAGLRGLGLKPPVPHR